MNDEDLRRLTVAELKIAEHEKKHDSVQESLKQLADGINTLVQAEIRRESDMLAFKRFGENITELTRRLDNVMATINTMREAQVKRELTAYKTFVWRAISIGGSVCGALAVAYITYHFGWKAP